MLITGIKSKPVYAPLHADARGRYHLMLGHGAGGVALLRVLKELEETAPAALGATRVLYLPRPMIGNASASVAITPESGAADAPADPLAELEALALAELKLFASVPELLTDFRALLERSLMGTRLYVAGPESFIGLAMKIALEFNLNKDEIRAEELGSLARRVYCIHCRATAEEVRTNIVRCGGCGRWLLVRDHYSRRLAAYMGVMADAEAPGELPEIREVFV
ncbi:MAG TPA: dimethylamine monooxygenase subunit DmmA family protein [Steroidobacteraceae bacterium]|nr:dimethylamine monooxygenase subunit DmmA family protein [Steroidobacteraceae bacterium]